MVKRIYNASGKLTEDELLDLGRLLLKAGYAVSTGKQKLDSKYIKYVEFSADLEGLDDGNKTS